jgi:hypothetical protein
MARIPMSLATLIGFAPAFHMSADPYNGIFLLLSLALLIPVIWMIVLMYNAFKVSLNLKGTKAVAGFMAD